MYSKTEITRIIAEDKKSLFQFVMDLCSFTLDEAGFDKESYGFYLHMAFQHQAYLQKEEWDKLCLEVTEAASTGEPLNWDEHDQELRERIANFAQTMVTEVTEAQQDNWAVKLIKTSYLNQIERARKSSEHAIKFLTAEKGQPVEDMSVSLLAPPDDKTSALYTEVLREHRAYLNSLLNLPFVLEKLCLSLASNKMGANYQPRKTAEMLAATLDTINAGLAAEGYERQTVLIDGLKLALDLAMPNIQLAGHQLVDTLSKDVLPLINTIIENSVKLEAAKKSILPTNNDGSDTDIAKARKAMLATLDVHFYSIQDILKETLLVPAEQCYKAASGVLGLAVTSTKITKNEGDFRQITKLFANFDKVASVCQELDPEFVPAWVKQTNGYYQQLKAKASIIETTTQSALHGLGVFYDYAASFVPLSVRNYLTCADALSEVLGKIDDLPNQFEESKVMAYFAFYKLAKRGELDGPLKAKFFEAYTSDLAKDKKLKEIKFDYDSYLRLEHQLEKKAHLDLDLALSQRIANFANIILEDASTTESLKLALDANEISNLQKLDILLLINRLQTLESEFNPKAPEAVFNELAAAGMDASKSKQNVHQAFAKEFLQPAVDRLLAQYKKKRLETLLEEMLDSESPNLSSDKARLRELYSKLKEKVSWTNADWLSFREGWKKQGDFKPEEFESVKNIAELSTVSKEVLKNREHVTPKEKTEKKTKDIFTTVSPHICKLLSLLRDRLEQQKDSCRELQELVAQDSKIAKLCDNKIKYIEALNSLIYNLECDIKKSNSETQLFIAGLLTGQTAELSKKELLKRFSLLDAPGKLIRLAWNVLPSTSDSEDASPLLNDTLIYNLFAYYTANTDIGNIVAMERLYKESLNNDPIPALIRELNDPLAIANIIPSQEKIMDAIIDKLIDTGSQQAVAWGVNYLKQAVSTLTRENLIKLLPYPFLADLALKAIQSEAAQASIAPIVNKLMDEFGGVVSEKAGELREAAKKRLYPLLGIEIQKTIEASVYNYAKNPNTASETDRDAFSMYYLQYREIKQANERFNSSETVKFLFPELLKGIQQQHIVDTIKEAFASLDEKLIDIPRAKTPFDETETQLQFLIEHLDLSDKDNDPLIRLALINSLLIMAMDASEQLTAQDKASKLQQQAIQKLSEALVKIPSLKVLQATVEVFADEGEEKEKEAEEFTAIPRVTSTSMFHAIASANKRATKMQLSRLKSSLGKTKELVNDELFEDKQMLESEEPLLGISLAKWEYYKSKFSRKILIVLSFLFELFSIVSTWVSIITPLVAGSGIVEVLITFLGLSGAVGASATGIGAAAVGALALLRLLYKVGMEIWYQRDEFKAIAKNESFLQRAGLTSLLLLKCFGLALVKTIFTDYLVANVSEFLAFGPIESLRNAFRVWPTRDRVETEQSKLMKLNDKLVDLETLIDKQLNFLAGKVDPETTLPFSDQSQKIDDAFNLLSAEIAETQKCLDETSNNSNDARFKIKDYATKLTDFNTAFNGLAQEIKLLKDLHTAQAGFKGEDLKAAEQKEKAIKEVAAEPKVTNTTTTKTAVVNLEAYHQKLPKVVQPQQSYIGQFWSLIRAKSSEVTKKDLPEKSPLVNRPLTESFIFIEKQPEAPSETTVKSVLPETPLDGSFIFINVEEFITGTLEATATTEPVKAHSQKKGTENDRVYSTIRRELFFGPVGDERASEFVNPPLDITP